MSVTGAAMVCGVLHRLLPESGTAGTLGKLLTGIFLALTVLRPLGNLELPAQGLLWDEWQAQASKAAQVGKTESENTIHGIIKDRCSAYILQKAQQLHLELEVELTLDAQGVPVSVRIQGNAGPYAKQKLQDIISQDLGIPKEKQVWT